MRNASAFVPAHISGFFQVCDEPSELERKGSRNCGPCLDVGVLTEARLEPASSTRVRVFIDGRPATEARTSAVAAKRILDMIDEPVNLEVHHRVGVPVGAGYGASGSGALGVALALPKVLELKLAREGAAKIAHMAEVECRTGLGDVGAQALGGLVIGLEPGAPPHGRWGQISFPKDVKVVCGTFGGLPTAKLLREEIFCERSKRLGGLALKKLLVNPTPKNFMEVSREFAEALGLLDDEIRTLIEAAVKAGAIGASQVMLGRAVFALVKEEKLEQVRSVFSEFIKPESVMVVGVDGEGARFLD